ncbi:hypothetical protein MMC14_004331 [Varicellaria rhodocarpa]|nr:hypothetical protein [Varicellaria rhodocarpa]
MATSRLAIRCLRTRTAPTGFRSSRPYSTNSQAGSNGGVQSAIIGGLAGGTFVFLGGYAYYHFSGAKTLVSTAQESKQYFDNTARRFKDSSPEPNEALKLLRQSALSYAAFIPGAKGYVESTFDDLDAVRAKHGGEVDKIVKEAYEELKGLLDKGISLDNAQDAWTILQKHSKRIGDLAGDAAQDILKNHPEIQKKVGGNIDQLKQMGDKYGPEAKKQVDQTWNQIQDIVKSGVSVDSANKIRKVIQEKIEVVKKIGDEPWKKGMEQAKPYLDKSPKIKSLVEENADKLKQGNTIELWEKVKEAASSGNTESIEKFIKSTVDQAKEQGGDISGGLSQYLNMIPGADQLDSKLSQLQDIAQKHGKEAETIVKETIDEIQQVLQRRLGEAEKLKEKAEKNAKGGEK